MSVELGFSDFFYPLSILRLKRFMDESQWFDKETHARYQLHRLNRILAHAREQSRFYRERYPHRIADLSELSALPSMSKETLRRHGEAMLTADHKRFNPVSCRTSGTTGEPVRFYLDKTANVLEFCYYWRYWGWAGYRLGAPFADLGLHHFLDRDVDALSHFNPITRRLSLNAARLSRKNAPAYVRAIRRHDVRFIKGPPSGLAMLATLLRRTGAEPLTISAVFTTGERLHSHQRVKIAQIFSCPVFDSYGHMERTIGVCQCPKGRYHINPEYGILEVEKVEKLCTGTRVIGRVIGTSLHNFAMPLIRYETGDLIELDADEPPCACGRPMPVVKRILGREQDLLVTPDERYIANAAIVFNAVHGVDWFQIVQHARDRIEVRIARNEGFTMRERARVKESLCRLMGPVAIDIVEVSSPSPPVDPGQKYRSVVSHVESLKR